MPEFASTSENQSRHRKDGTNVYSIPPGAAFLRTLAEAIIQGEFCSDLDLKNNPLALADSVIFVPTRRAARGLSVEILEAAERVLGLQSIILPRIRTIGDLDDEELLLGLESDEISALASLPGDTKVINTVERHLSLARLTQNWAKALSPETKSLLDNENITLPSSASDALFLARELAKFMDQIETEEADWQDIEKIVGDNDFSHWWQLTLDFLKIVMDVWPDFLEAGNLINPSDFRNKVIDFRINELNRKPVKGFVLAAGTTGSIPATSRLLEAIKNLPNGAIVLPGLDSRLPQNIFKRFVDTTEMTEDGASSTHPQYGLAKLVQRLKVDPREVQQLGDCNGKSLHREQIVNLALLPAEDSQTWVSAINDYSTSQIKDAFEAVSLIQASSEHEEALGIALLLREALESPTKTAALVTPDRKLARRVSAELERFDIQIDDTAGEPLLASKPVSFLRQLLRIIFDNDDFISLSSFLKSDLIVLGGDYDDHLELFELLEIALVRSSIKFPDLSSLSIQIEKIRDEIEDENHAPHQLKNLDKGVWGKLIALSGQISDALAGLNSLAKNKAPITPSELMNELRKTAETLSSDTNGNHLIFEDAGGPELQALFESHQIDHNIGFEFEPGVAPSVFDALIAGARTRKTGRTRSRLHIYGTLEARLQSSDLLILGGLNESNWPQSSNNDPYLNRPMRAHLNLPLPERRIGLAAHDFTQFSGAEEVVYSRALKVEDAPSIESRWLQRLKILLGKNHAAQMTERGNVYLDLARQIDRSTAPSKSIGQPAPTPPVSARPKKLSITEIETWIRDPYAIYAKHVLELKPLDPILREADPALRGTLYHDILAKFIDFWKGEINTAACEKMSEITDQVFQDYKLPPEIDAMWRPRFAFIAEGFLDWESKRRHQIKHSHCEINLRGEIGTTGFKLTGRADRVDETVDGLLTIIDYKTGSHPSNKQARIFSPQLSLEGALASKGYAEGISEKDVDDLFYVRLREKEKFTADDITRGQDKKGVVLNAGQLAQSAYEELEAHIRAYQDESQAYISQYAPQPNKRFSGDYDHLARIREWSIDDGENEDVGE